MIISKQKDFVNGNEAYLLGVNKSAQQVWIEVLSATEIKCDSIPTENINLNYLLVWKVFDNNSGDYLSKLLTQYVMLNRFLKRHPDQKEHDTDARMQVMVDDILSVLKPRK